MTSSLVGSEMCIRDRSRTSTSIATRSTPCRRTWVSPWQTEGPQSCSSVSYTHLTLPTICSV
eukprot:10717924-Prorocentrum_lima.AAC.1